MVTYYVLDRQAHGPADPGTSIAMAGVSLAVRTIDAATIKAVDNRECLAYSSPMPNTRRKLSYVICAQCGRTDQPDSTVIPHNTGTATVMHCMDCDGAPEPKPEHRYQGGFAQLCRACCPTGHGTRWPEEVSNNG